MNAITNFTSLIDYLRSCQEKKRVAVIRPRDESTQKAVKLAEDAGFMIPVIVDDEQPETAAALGVQMVREGKADVLMKGLVNTDDLLRAVLNKETGLLPQGKVLTHVTCAEIEGHEKLLFCSDVAVIPHPTAEQREEQLKYMLSLMRSFGIGTPRVGLINCTEKVNPKHFPFTVEYRDLIEKAQTGAFGSCIIDGPLDLKTCFSPEALHKKGIDSPLEGNADGVIFPDIQAGNVFYKTITCFCKSKTAAMLCGPQVPVVLPSRGDSPENKFLSLAMACMSSLI